MGELLGRREVSLDRTCYSSFGLDGGFASDISSYNASA